MTREQIDALGQELLDMREDAYARGHRDGWEQGREEAATTAHFEAMCLGSHQQGYRCDTALDIRDSIRALTYTPQPPKGEPAE